jgi:hypothetical protein
MKPEPHDERLDDLIHAAIGRNGPSFDFQRWKRSHRDRIDEFQSQMKPSPTRAIARIGRRTIMIRTLKIAAAAAIFLGVCLGVPFLNRHGDAGAAFARIAEQIEKAQTITWKVTFYNHFTSRDGRRTWVESETREMAYKAPGLYRELYHPTGRGGVEHTSIVDSVNLKSLTLVPQERRATLRELALAGFDSRGPFAGALEHLGKQDLEWVGKRTTPNGEVNVFRRAFKRQSDNEEWSYDFWIDVRTKRLVAIQMPGADIYDPETDAARLNPSEKQWSTGRPACSVQHDIDFDARLDDSLFSLDPPAGYAFESEPRARVTEAEMIEYLGAMADYNGRTFPDQPYSIDVDRLNEIDDKAKEDRTPAEQKLREITHQYMMANLNLMPTGHFVKDHTVPGTFRYLGKGVKLGDAGRIVCWYKLKDTGTYRAVYGDLRVRDVAPADLPLPVEP